MTDIPQNAGEKKNLLNNTTRKESNISECRVFCRAKGSVSPTNKEHTDIKWGMELLQL